MEGAEKYIDKLEKEDNDEIGDKPTESETKKEERREEGERIKHTIPRQEEDETDETEEVAKTTRDKEEGSRNIKQNLRENDIGRKLEMTSMRNPAESHMRESLALSKLINSNLKGGDNAERGRTSCTGKESWRRGTSGGRGLVEKSVETQIS